MDEVSLLLSTSQSGARYTMRMTTTRYDVTFTGHVQGVFFRATAEKIARNYDVTGWVRNEPQGSVRMVVEGEPHELDRFVEAVKDAKRENIRDVSIEQTEATGEFDGIAGRH
jgi:acylphosphatase